MDIRHRKPLLGFGPIGLIALAILLIVVIALLCGWNPVFTVASWMWYAGGETMIGFAQLMMRYWYSPYVAYIDVGYGPIAILLTTVALFVLPTRASRAGVALLVGSLFVDFTQYHLALWLFANAPLAKNDAFLVVKLVALVLASGGLYLCFRRWWVVPPVFLMWGVEFCLESYAARTGSAILQSVPYDTMRWTNHILVAAPQFVIAIRARARGLTGEPCPKCSYNLAGLPHGSPCPECGASALLAD